MVTCELQAQHMAPLRDVKEDTAAIHFELVCRSAHDALLVSFRVRLHQLGRDRRQLSGLGPQPRRKLVSDRSRPPLPRFRTIQICHKDLPATPGQVGTKWEESSK
jgi:hypothetical protein